MKKGRRKGTKYNMDVRLKSQPFTGKLNGFLNLGDAVSTNLALDYNVYRVGRDRVVINGKLSNKSTAAFRKYTLSSYVCSLYLPCTADLVSRGVGVRWGKGREDQEKGQWSLAATGLQESSATRARLPSGNTRCPRTCGPL